MATPPQDELLLTPADAAPILGLSASMVRVLNDLGRLRGFKTLTGMRLFLRRDVEDLAKERARAKAKRRKGG